MAAMRAPPLLLLVSLFFPLPAFAQPTTEPAIIPRPSHLEVAPGRLPLDHGERIIVNDKTRAVGDYAAELLAPAIGAHRTVVDGVGDDGWDHGDIVLLTTSRPEL